MDLGAGPEAKLARELSDLGITDKTISLSPDYSVEKSRHRAYSANPEAPKVAGLGQALPIADRSVDVVLALEVAAHLRGDALEKTISEMARILKAGGVAHMGPTPLTDEYIESLENDPELQEQLKSLGVSMTFREILKNGQPNKRKIDLHAEKHPAFNPVPYDVILRKVSENGK